MSAPYFDDDDRARDRIPMLCSCLGVHVLLAGVLALFVYRPDQPLMRQIGYSDNGGLLCLLVLASASCTIGVIICLAVTATHLRRSTAWLLGICAAPATIGLLAALFLATG